MNILFLSDRFPWPLEDGGNQRTYYVLKHLASLHHIMLISHGPPDVSLGPLPDLCDVRLVERPRMWRRAGKFLLQRNHRNKSLFIAKNWFPEILAAAESAMRDQRFDAVHFNHLDIGCFLTLRKWPPSVFDSHNCLSSMAAEYAQEAGWRSYVMPFEANLLARVENSVCSEATAVLACSTKDAESFLRIAPNANVHVVPNGVDCDFCAADLAEDSSEMSRLPPTLVFVGAMDYGPNESGVVWFCNSVLPNIRSAFPDVEFHIVGRNPSRRVQDLRKSRQEAQRRA